MEPIVKQIHKRLIKNRKTISIAESCTGGLLSSLLTQISGSSQYFVLGVVTYSNSSKLAVLNISLKLISKKGAVSKEAALNLAQSVRKLAKTDFSIGVTGIAGPSGATPLKPVGTVFIAIDSRDRKLCRKFLFKGKRNSIRKQAALKALELLKLVVNKYEDVYCY